MRSSAGVGLASNLQPMLDSLILGIDVGTSSLKVIFITLDGEMVKRSEAKLVSQFGKDGEAEQSPNDYLAALKDVLRENANLLDRVISIGLSGQTPTVVCIDERGNPTFPALTWQDNRAIRQSEALAEEFGNPLSVVGTSLPWSPSACPAKMFWIAEHRTDVVAKTKWVLQPKDFIGFHLTGKAISDPWSTKGICNVVTRLPIDSLLKRIGWNSSIMPELRDGFQTRGDLTAHAAKVFGFPRAGIPVSTGWSDAMCGMLSLGVFTDPSPFIITGTSAIVGISTHNPPEDGGGLYIIPETCAPLSVLYGPTQSSGAAIAWFGQMQSLSADEVIELALTSTCDVLPIFVPYISGERAPIWRPDVRGSFVKIDSQHNLADFARALLEGISFGERHVLEVAADLLRDDLSSIKLGGHAGNDPRWDQIRLRSLGVEIERFEDLDTTNRGNAMLALAGLGVDLAQAYQRLKAPSISSTPGMSQIEYSTRVFSSFGQAQKQARDLADSP